MFTGLAMCYFVPWLRCLWAPDIKLGTQENSGQIIVDILAPGVTCYGADWVSPGTFSRPCMDAPDRRPWKPCPKPATLTTDGDCLFFRDEQEQRPSDWNDASNPSSDRSCPDSGALDSASGCCSSNCTSWSISPRSLDSPGCGSEVGNDGADDASVTYAAAPDSWGPAGDLTASNEKAALTSSYGRLLVASDASLASPSTRCRKTPRTSQRYITQGYGLNNFYTDAAVCEASPAGGLGANALQHAAEVSTEDIDGLLASVIAMALWQDDA
ncbi:hypothetical protein Vretimale_12319 [Volvox reticuliferus]|uniref:Uncharacterized protein n=1 Tax=Volvox reticuliferus TaxID=1737510 RepID=A0A8J4CJ47_9CHLO|nr:hypothetical protein Vretifemale_8879 [Volvox reticuliferus]GIM08237.1 hypothetical protein Vretimale_12319 [Volvox reticuliferus]